MSAEELGRRLASQVEETTLDHVRQLPTSTTCQCTISPSNRYPALQHKISTDVIHSSSSYSLHFVQKQTRTLPLSLALTRSIVCYHIRRISRGHHELMMITHAMPPASTSLRSSRSQPRDPETAGPVCSTFSQLYPYCQA